MKASKPIRALWLMNHTTLRSFEVPLLREFGVEVYLPKIFPYDEGNLSASVSNEYDDCLTLPKADLEALDRHNFYTGITPEIRRLINQHFDIAFFGYFPEQLAALVRNFHGVLVMRPFGLANGVTYGAVTESALGHAFKYEIEKLGDRFWFGQAYPHLADIETGVFRRRAIHLPLGLAGSDASGPWVGGDKRILFVCPRIGSSPYFNRIYREFLSHFSGFDYVIGGAQPIAVNDRRVLGFLSRKDYESVMRHAQVMFYHSQERNHVHYHPFEAIAIGMPLVFMADGMLDTLGGRALPGRARTLSEARKKLGRILKDDRAFISEVVSAQRALLKPMSMEYCRPIWSAHFGRILDSVKASDPAGTGRRATRIAVVLPEAYRGGTLDVAKIVAKMVKKGAAERGENVQVVFAYPHSPIYSNDDFGDLVEDGIPRRRFFWRALSSCEYDAVRRMTLNFEKPSHEHYVVPDDGANFLLDCDIWLFATDRVPQAIAPLRPYILYVQDYLQRYFPELFGSVYEKPFIETARHAAAVLVSTPHAREDAIQYAGVPANRVILVPHVVELDKHRVNAAAPSRKDYFVWTTNTGAHKKHMQSLKAFEIYFNELGESALDVQVTGVDTHLFDPEVDCAEPGPLIAQVRAFIAQRPVLKRRLVFHGELDESSYSRLLGSARFLFHNVTMDNGTLCAVEAAYLGVPTLSSDYPPMRFLSERYRLNCRFMHQDRLSDVVQHLLGATRDAADWRASLPSREFLDSLSWRSVSGEFWGAIRMLAQ